jgi:CRP-like cAMP-binding protein
MFQHIKKYIDSCVHLSNEQHDYFNNILIHKSFPKKKMLLSAGEICQFEAFIVKGCVKTYFIDKNGFEIILTFATENWWISDIKSFHEQIPSEMYIETIEETELLIINPQTKEQILHHIPSLERMFRLMVQRHLGTYQERLFSNIALTAEERYILFLQKYPDIPQRVPQHLIASYLGISAEFLSRIRSRKSKNKKPPSIS